MYITSNNIVNRLTMQYEKLIGVLRWIWYAIRKKLLPIDNHVK